MDLEIRHLRYFLAVADELSFTRAAQRLNIAQPALSSQIARLERRLGTPLFERTTRRVTLTAAGLDLRERAREADLVMRAIEETFTIDVPATLRMGLEMATLGSHLAAALGDGLRPVRTQVASGEETLARLRDGRLDLIQYADVAAAPLSAGPPLRSRVLLTEPSEVVLAADHPLHGATQVWLGQLSQERWVTRLPGSRLYSFVVDACRAAGFEPVLIHHADDSHAITEAILGGAVTFGSPLNIATDGLVQRPMPDGPTRDITLAWNPDTVQNQVMTRAVAASQEWYVRSAWARNPSYARERFG
ncbi:LysR family transcriptional regulator [Micromonospora sp. NPDC005324]|uniref:LysR family transcriptional regulator n=1 Tax=Micromonospora sp. NPDC005324 TaxID=3157033 RepID=UPI0033A69CDE